MPEDKILLILISTCSLVISLTYLLLFSIPHASWMNVSPAWQEVSVKMIVLGSDNLTWVPADDRYILLTSVCSALGSLGFNRDEVFNALYFKWSGILIGTSIFAFLNVVSCILIFVFVFRFFQRKYRGFIVPWICLAVVTLCFLVYTLVVMLMHLNSSNRILGSTLEDNLPGYTKLLNILIAVTILHYIALGVVIIIFNDVEEQSGPRPQIIFTRQRIRDMDRHSPLTFSQVQRSSTPPDTPPPGYFEMLGSTKMTNQELTIPGSCIGSVEQRAGSDTREEMRTAPNNIATNFAETTRNSRSSDPYPGQLNILGEESTPMELLSGEQDDRVRRVKKVVQHHRSQQEQFYTEDDQEEQLRPKKNNEETLEPVNPVIYHQVCKHVQNVPEQVQNEQLNFGKNRNNMINDLGIQQGQLNKNKQGELNPARNQELKLTTSRNPEGNISHELDKLVPAKNQQKYLNKVGNHQEKLKVVSNQTEHLIEGRDHLQHLNEGTGHQQHFKEGRSHQEHLNKVRNHQDSSNKVKKQKEQLDEVRDNQEHLDEVRNHQEPLNEIRNNQENLHEVRNHQENLSNPWDLLVEQGIHQ